jgi:hypothetical protein
MQEYLDGYHDLPETAPEKQVEQGGLFAEAVQEAQAQAKSEKIEPEQVKPSRSTLLRKLSRRSNRLRPMHL